MKKPDRFVAITALILVLPMTLFAKDSKSKPIKCSGSSIEIDACLKAEIKKADEHLNEVYQNVLKSLSSGEEKEKLKASQRAWLKFFEDELAFVSTYWKDGTYGSVRYGYLKAEKLRRRSEELEDLIAP